MKSSLSTIALFVSTFAFAHMPAGAKMSSSMEDVLVADLAGELNNAARQILKIPPQSPQNTGDPKVVNRPVAGESLLPGETIADCIKRLGGSGRKKGSKETLQRCNPNAGKGQGTGYGI